MIQHTQAAAGLGPLARVTGAISSLKEIIARRRLFKRTQRELNALSNRELKDLGMHRSMVTRVAREAAYGK